MQKHTSILFNTCILTFATLMFTCNQPTDTVAPPIDATYISIIESKPALQSTIKAKDTLRLKFEYNIDEYDYCDSCSYYLDIIHHLTNTTWYQVRIIGWGSIWDTLYDKHGIRKISIPFENIVDDTVINPLLLELRICKIKGNWNEAVSIKQLEFCYNE